MKNRLNLTINEDLLVKAKKFATDSGVSLSSIVEDGLSKAICKNESIDVDGILSDFHKRAFKKISKEPSDKEVDTILREGRDRKYS